jgi:hypothetical protein
MTTINVQFSDSTQKSVVSYFGCPQDPSAYPNQGQIDTSDPRYAAFYSSLPPIAQPGMPTPS